MSNQYDLIGKNFKSRKENDHSDFFPTYHHITRQYLQREKFSKKSLIMDPCAGNNDIIKILNEFGYKNTLGIDICPRCSVVCELDFLKNKFKHNYVDHIVTNPPFCMANDFIKKSSVVAKKTMSFVLPLDYLHGMERYKDIYSNGVNNFFLHKVYVMVRRPMFGSEYSPEGLMPTGAQTFCWLLFKKRNFIVRFFIKIFKLTARVKWINNSKYMGKHMMADEQYLPGLK